MLGGLPIRISVVSLSRNQQVIPRLHCQKWASKWFVNHKRQHQNKAKQANKQRNQGTTRKRTKKAGQKDGKNNGTNQNTEQAQVSRTAPEPSGTLPVGISGSLQTSWAKTQTVWSKKGYLLSPKPTNQPTYLPTHHPPTHLPTYPPALPTYHHPTTLPTNQPTNQPTYLPPSLPPSLPTKQTQTAHFEPLMAGSDRSIPAFVVFSAQRLLDSVRESQSKPWLEAFGPLASEVG